MSEEREVPLGQRAPTAPTDVSNPSLPRPHLCCFSFNIQQKLGEGEDADPLVLMGPNGKWGMLAVFDGMGGAGATQYRQPEGMRTGAYLASRLAASVVGDHFKDDMYAWIEPTERAEILKRNLQSAFRQEILGLEKVGGSRLGGSMTRRLPTTMTCLGFKLAEAINVSFEVIWAGDSRAYLLTPNCGLQQLSTDDIKSKADAMRSLIEDSPVSNCIDADSDFALNVTSGLRKAPLVLIAATDGCFGYCLSPAHFEHSLLCAMADANDGKSWSEAIQRRLGAVAGDDLSMTALAIGWTSFQTMREAFATRLEQLSVVVEPLTTVSARVAQLAEERLVQLNLREEARSELWDKYRQTYESHLRSADQDQNRTTT